MSWQSYYFWTVLIISILAFQCGRAWEMEELKKEYEKLDSAWLQDCDLNKERRK